MKIFGIVGWKNSGKTTLVEKIIKDLVNRGYTASSIKHAHHEFEIDKEGKDSYRHRQAGATQVIVSSENLWAMISSQAYAEDTVLEKLLGKLDPVDFIIVEGYKSEKHPKIECYRLGCPKKPLIESDSSIIGIVHDLKDFHCKQEQFKFDEIKEIVDFIDRAAASVHELYSGK